MGAVLVQRLFSNCRSLKNFLESSAATKNYLKGFLQSGGGG